MIVRTFHIESIHCSGCESSIRQALGTVSGVIDVLPGRFTNQVRVRFDETTVDEKTLVDALASAGFPVCPATPSHVPATPARDAIDGTPVRRDAARGDRESGEAESSARAEIARYAVQVAAIAVIALAGSVGYMLYPRFDLPPVQGAGLLALGAAAGFASFFSPCSFPLLLGLLGRHAAAGTPRGEATRPGVLAGALAAGAAVFLLFVGFVIALGGRALFAGVTFTSLVGITIRAAVGGLLVLLGLIQAGVLPFSLHAVSRAATPLTRRQARLARKRPIIGLAAFGCGYVVAGFG